MTQAASVGLLCPVCKVDLVMTERKDVEIDYCPKCRGVWLDRGELDKIIEKSAAQEAQQQRPAAPQPQAQPHPQQARIRRARRVRGTRRIWRTW